MKREFMTSLKLYKRERKTLHFDSRSLEKLIGEMSQGVFYLFYGYEEALKRLLYSLCIKAIRELNKPALIITLRYYHQGRILDTYDLGYTAIQYNLDPEQALKNIYVITVYNVKQARNIDKILRQGTDYSIILVWATTDLFTYRKYPIMMEFLNIMKKHIEDNIIVFFSKTSSLSRKHPPKPDGPIFFKHLVHVMLYLEPSIKNRKIIKTLLVKHPSKKNGLTFLKIDYHTLVDITPPERWLLDGQNHQ